jgi:sigma-E factor negative regulatory protein RseC
MNETPGLVTRVEDGLAYVQIGARVAGCGRCHEVGGCGSSLLGGAQSQAPRTYRVPNRIGAQVGDDVLLTIPDGALLKVSLLAYLLPVLLVIAGAALGTRLSDAMAILGAAAGLVVGMAVLRFAQSRLIAAREPLLSMRIKSCAFHLHKDIPQC